jgi:1-acyl-sn-glycerol-3-phosphate acyltransferase
MSAVSSFLVGQSRTSRFAYLTVRGILKAFFLLYNRLEIEGRHNLPDSGAFVLAPIHRSYVDSPIAACVTRRRMRFMGKDSVWKYRPMGWIASMLGAFPVTRGSADREALRRGIAVLQGGEPLVLFPEGERKSGPVVQPMFDGAAFIAAKAQVPIIPVGIGGSEKVMPKKAKFLYPRRIHVIIGEPLMPALNDAGRLPRAELAALSAQLHTRLQELFDQAQAAVGDPNSSDQQE